MENGKPWKRFWRSVRGSDVNSIRVLPAQMSVQGDGAKIVAGFTTLQNLQISGADFSGADLRSRRWTNVSFVGCSFDRADLGNLRMQSTEIRECSFRHANFRGSHLGMLLGESRNRFIDVDFNGADMRNTYWMSAAFDRCFFKDTNLEGVNLHGSTLSHCVFEGELRDVVFNRSAYKRTDLPENAMEDIDFSKARLRYIAFRNLNLDKVRFPMDDEHLVFKNYHDVLDRAIKRLREEDDPVAKRLVSFLLNEFKWTSPHQVQGMLNRADLVELGGETTPERLLATL